MEVAEEGRRGVAERLGWFQTMFFIQYIYIGSFPF